MRHWAACGLGGVLTMVPWCVHGRDSLGGINHSNKNPVPAECVGRMNRGFSRRKETFGGGRERGRERGKERGIRWKRVIILSVTGPYTSLSILSAPSPKESQTQQASPPADLVLTLHKPYHTIPYHTLVMEILGTSGGSGNS